MNRGVARVRGTEMAYDDAGRGAAVVLLHGFPFDRSMWREQAQALSGTCRVVAPDLRGQGETPLGGATLTMGEMAEDIAALLDALNVGRAVVGGLSMGGYVAFELLKAFPERIAALVLCDTHAGADSEETRNARFDLIEQIESEGAEALIDVMLPKLICENTKQNKKDLVETIEEMFRAAEPKAAIAALRGMAKRKDNNNLLDQIDVPTQLIFGAEDKVTNLEMAEKMRREIPDSRLSIIENAGHYSNLEQPEIFNQTLIDFLKTVEI